LLAMASLPADPAAAAAAAHHLLEAVPFVVTAGRAVEVPPAVDVAVPAEAVLTEGVQRRGTDYSAAVVRWRRVVLPL
jgi:hypothetical protein